MSKKIIFEFEVESSIDEKEDSEQSDNEIEERIIKPELIPWIEKYRPKRLKYVVGQEYIVTMLTPYLSTKYSEVTKDTVDQNLPHLIFYGPPGTGKTSTILAFAYELFGPKRFKERILELNASDNKGINFVRNDIKKFSEMMNGTADPDYPSPDFKIIILDEADSMTQDAQAALRASMEETSEKTKFCIICNYVNQIIDPIKSRCVQIQFKPIPKSFLKEKLKSIAINEKTQINNDIIDIIVDISDGDARNAINTLQHAVYLLKCNGKLTADDIYNITGNVEIKVLKKIWKVITNKHIKDIMLLTQDICSAAYNIESIINYLSEKNLNEKYSDKKKAEISFIISETDKRIVDSGDECVQLLNILVQIGQIIKRKD